MLGRSLTTRLVAVIATTTGACVVMVAAAVGWASYRNEEAHAIAETQASSAYLSSGVVRLFERATQATRDQRTHLAVDLARGGLERRHALADLKSALSSEPDLFGIWLISEDQGFDGRDAEHRGAFGSTARGVFAPYWYRNASGEIVPRRTRTTSRRARQTTTRCRRTCR